MSYDLFITAPPGSKVTTDALRRYFQGRPHYAVDDEGAWYENPDTEVYFGFYLGPYSDDPEAPPSVAGFNLNYLRPHVFALEAEPEVSAFLKTFGLGIDDPQEMGDGPYGREGFLRGWNNGNEFALRAQIEAEGLDEVGYTAPTESIERCWRWNLGREARQRRLGDTVFVPRIAFALRDGQPQTTVVWGDATPAALPVVDSCLIAREELAPRRMRRKWQDWAVVDRGAVEAVVSGYPLHDGPVPYRLLNYEQQDSRLADWVHGLSGGPLEQSGVEVLSLDTILDREVVGRLADA